MLGWTRGAANLFRAIVDQLLKTQSGRRESEYEREGFDRIKYLIVKYAPWKSSFLAVWP